MLPGAKSFLSVLVHAGVVRVEELTEPFSTHIPVCSDDITESLPRTGAEVPHCHLARVSMNRTKTPVLVTC